jgi:hypothetical protein
LFSLQIKLAIAPISRPTRTIATIKIMIAISHLHQ